MGSALAPWIAPSFALALAWCAAGCVAEDVSPTSGATGSGGSTSTSECHACAATEQCCEAAVFGYTGGDLCYPEDKACPLGCPDSDVVCALQSYCQLDPQTGTYGCKESCESGVTCGFNVCCPMGSRCDEGVCKLADMTIDADEMEKSASITVLDFAEGSCEVVEKCVGGPGKRTLLRFDLVTPNIGLGDLFLGSPLDNPLFEFSPCHGHYHFSTYADYRLRDANGKDVAFGHKQAFCLRDDAPSSPGAPAEAKYNCSFQGIQAGWSDDYEAELPCQWVDVTGLPAGEYTLHVELNYDKILAESSYENNVAEVKVTVPPNSCPNGCVPTDAMCCQPGDPCGWAQNGSCDCADHFGWDTADCGACVPSDPFCLVASSCPAGCSADEGACCADGDPCGLAGNAACDCEGHYSWDDADCIHCDNPDPPCPVNTCPNGCTTAEMSPQCCQEGNPCGWTTDGFCDCGGQFTWDTQDCSHCTTASPACP